MPAGPIRIVIVDDHALVREATRKILQADPRLRVVGEAEDGFEALALAESTRPDLMVLDLRMPRLSGIEVAQRMRQVSPKTRILVLSAYDDDDYVFAAMEAGAAGYLLKTAHGDEVVSAIHAVMTGEVVLQSAVAAKFVRHHREGDHSAPLSESLTPREMEILRLAAVGMDNKEIAQRVKLSRRTVEGHLSRVFRKVTVGNRVEAILFGASQGWFVLDSGALDASLD